MHQSVYSIQPKFWLGLIENSNQVANLAVGPLKATWPPAFLNSATLLSIGIRLGPNPHVRVICSQFLTLFFFGVK